MAAMSSDTASPGRRWQAQAAILVVGWAILFGLVVGLGRLITGPLSDSVRPTDNDLARWFADERSPSRNQVAESMSLFGETITIIALAAVIAIVVWLWRRNIREVLFVALATSGVSGIYILAATADPRPRPPVKVLDPGLNPTQSYPSGHVAAATALYGLIVVLVWTYARVARWWVAPLLLLPLLVAVARLYMGAHHLSDVLTSVVFAAIWLTVTAVVLLPRPAEDPSASAQGQIPMRR
jgi:membrane-associated phospholipid phosphatase